GFSNAAISSAGAARTTPCPAIGAPASRSCRDWLRLLLGLALGLQRLLGLVLKQQDVICDLRAELVSRPTEAQRGEGHDDFGRKLPPLSRLHDPLIRAEFDVGGKRLHGCQHRVDLDLTI